MMNKKLFLFTIFSIIMLFEIYGVIKAKEFMSFNQYTILNDSKDIEIYKNDEKIEIIYNSVFLDIDNSYLLYNHDDSVYLYNFIDKSSNLIKNRSYNALFMNDQIIFESDYDSNYTCKNLLDIVQYRNCYKIYSYNINTKEQLLLPLIGMDNYLTDIEETYISYNSIHSMDDYCLAVCSYMNIFNYEQSENYLIKEYGDIILDMSGNGTIDNGKLYFESVPSIYGCNYSQIFLYHIFNQTIEMITIDGDNCFNDNSEIISANNNYMIFKTNYNNYTDRIASKYIYSYIDNKYSEIENSCKIANYVQIGEINLSCYIDNNFQNFKIDDIPPFINDDIIYTALKENETKFINQLDYFDNLTSKENMAVFLLDDLSKEGEHMIEIRLCDRFNNCTLKEVLVNIIDIDTTPPKIYCQNRITIKGDQLFDINKYGYAIDNVDGRLKLNLLSEINFSNKGNYIILVESTDTSGNKSYKELELVIYNDLGLKSMYFVLVSISIILIGIIYILRFKNRQRF